MEVFYIGETIDYYDERQNHMIGQVEAYNDNAVRLNNCGSYNDLIDNQQAVNTFLNDLGQERTKETVASATMCFLSRYLDKQLLSWQKQIGRTRVVTFKEMNNICVMQINI